MVRRIKIVILCGICIAVIILSVMGKRLFISYGLGFVLGCANLAFMALLFSRVLSLKPARVALFPILSYLMRYTMIALGMIEAAKWGVMGIILFAGGLLTVNFSYVVLSYSGNSIIQGK